MRWKRARADPRPKPGSRSLLPALHHSALPLSGRHLLLLCRRQSTTLSLSKQVSLISAEALLLILLPRSGLLLALPRANVDRNQVHLLLLPLQSSKKSSLVPLSIRLHPLPKSSSSLPLASSLSLTRERQRKRTTWNRRSVATNVSRNRRAWRKAGERK